MADINLEANVGGLDEILDKVSDVKKDFGGIGEALDKLGDKKIDVIDDEKLNRLRAYRQEIEQLNSALSSHRQSEQLRMLIGEMEKGGEAVPSELRSEYEMYRKPLQSLEKRWLGEKGDIASDIRAIKARPDALGVSEEDYESTMAGLSRDEMIIDDQLSSLRRDKRRQEKIGRRQYRKTKAIGYSSFDDEDVSAPDPMDPKLRNQMISESVRQIAPLAQLPMLGRLPYMAGMAAPAAAIAGAGMLANMIGSRVAEARDVAGSEEMLLQQFSKLSGQPSYVLGADVSIDDELSMVGIMPLQKMQYAIQMGHAFGGKQGIGARNEALAFALESGIDPSQAMGLTSQLRSSYTADPRQLGVTLESVRTLGQDYYGGRNQLAMQNAVNLAATYRQATGVPMGQAEMQKTIGALAGYAEAGDVGVLSGASHLQRVQGAGSSASGATNSFLLRTFIAQTEGPHTYEDFLFWKEELFLHDDEIKAQGIKEFEGLAGPTLANMGLTTIHEWRGLKGVSAKKGIGGGKSIEYDVQLSESVIEHNIAKAERQKNDMSLGEGSLAGIITAFGRWKERVWSGPSKAGVARDIKSAAGGGYMTFEEGAWVPIEGDIERIGGEVLHEKYLGAGKGYSTMHPSDYSLEFYKKHYMEGKAIGGQVDGTITVGMEENMKNMFNLAIDQQQEDTVKIVPQVTN